MASTSGCSGPPTKRLKQTLLSFALSTTKTTGGSGSGSDNVKHAIELQSVSEADIIRPGGNVQTVVVEVHNNEDLETGHTNTITGLTTTTSAKKPCVW